MNRRGLFFKEKQSSEGSIFSQRFENQKGFSPLFIILGIILIIGIAGGIYYFGKTQSPKSQPKNLVTTSLSPQLTLSSSPTSSVSPILTGSDANTIPNNTECLVNDYSFCPTFTSLQSLISKKNFNSLTSYQDLSDLICNIDTPSYNTELCAGVAAGKIVRGYNIGFNQSGGEIVSKNKYISTLNDIFTKNPYTYRGSLTQENKGQIVYLSDDKKNLVVLWLKKINQSNWRIKLTLLGIASNDYINLDPITFSYINFQ